MVVDNTRLSAAFKKLREPRCEFSRVFWHKEMENKGEAIMGNLRLQDLNNIPIPVSKENLEKIKAKCQAAQFGKGLNKTFDFKMKQAWEIPASKIHLDCQLEPMLASIVAPNLLGCNNIKDDFVMKLNKLVLYPPGGHFKSCYNPSSYKKELRTLAKVILSIPVEDGHEGGKLKIHFNGDRMEFCMEVEPKSSATLFSLTAVYSDNYYEMEPVTSGSILTLEFKLMSKHPFLLSRSSSIHYSTFFSALSEIRDSFEPLANNWTMTSSLQNQMKSIVETFNCKTTCAIPSANKECEKVAIPAAPHEEKMEHMWIFPLKQDYSSSVDFGTLSRRDLIYFELLRSISFIDVHLAIVAQSIPQENSSDFTINCEDEDKLKNRSCWIDEWIYSKKCVPICGKLPKFKLDIKTQFLGNIEQFLRKTCNQNPITNQHYTIFYHVVFIIQPRQQSIYLGCYRNFDRVLDQMCFLAKSSTTEEPIRQNLTTSLKHCLSFCRVEPDRVWNGEKLLENVSRAQRLMDVCTILNAKEEGLELLAILGMNLEVDPEISEIDPSAKAGQSKHSCEGIRDTGVAEAIANFQCRVSGWKDCSEFVLKLIQPANLKTQLNNFTNLIKNFVDNGCLEGAIKTAHRLWFVFGQLDWSNGFKKNEMQTYIKMVAFMERNPRLADPQRIPQLLSFFRSLRSDQQCQIVIDCENEEDYFKNVPSCVQFYREFCRILSEVELENSPRVSSKICDVIEYVSNLEDDSLLISLIDKIILGKCSEVVAGAEDLPRNLLLEEIIQSENIWNHEPLVVNRLLASPTVASFLHQMFDDRIHNFYHMITSKDTVKDGKLTVEVTKMLSNCQLFARCMEKHPQFTDPVRLASFTNLVSRLSIAELAYLFNRVSKSGCNRFKHQVSNSSVLSSASVICHHSLLRSSELINSQCIDSIKVFNRFVYLEKPSELQSLVVSVCQRGEKFGWKNIASQGFVEQALKILLSWKDADSNVKTFHSNQVCYMVAILIKSWVNEFAVWELIQYDLDNHVPETLKDCRLSHKMSAIFKFLIEAERNWPGPFADKNSAWFKWLFTQLPFKLYVLLIENILLYELEQVNGTMKDTNFRVNCPSCFHLFRELCQQCLSHRHYSDTSQEILLKCFIWLDNDYNSLNLICSKISPTQIKNIVSSPKIQKFAFVASSHGKTAFCSLIDRCIQDLEASMYPDLTWIMPQAKYPENPEIEAFLHSTMRELKYGNFTSRRDANNFVELLQKDPSLGLLVRVNQKTPRLWEVDIVKIRPRHYVLPTEEEAKKLELVKLTELRASLCPNVKYQTSQEQRGEKRKTSD